MGDSCATNLSSPRPTQLSLEAGTIFQRRRSDNPKPCSTGTRPVLSIRNSISAGDLSLQNFYYPDDNYHCACQRNVYFDLDIGSYDSLPDVCLTSPTGTERPLIILSPESEVKHRGRSASSLMRGNTSHHTTRGYSNPEVAAARDYDAAYTTRSGYSNPEVAWIRCPDAAYIANSDYSIPHRAMEHPERGSKTAGVEGPAKGSLFKRRKNSRSSCLDENQTGKVPSVDTIGSLHIGYAHSEDAKRVVKMEQSLAKHAVKTKLNRSEVLIDKAFALININSEDTVREGLFIVYEIMNRAWYEPVIGFDVAYGLNDYIRECGYLDILCQLIINANHLGESCSAIRLQAYTTLERCLAASNREYIFRNGYTDKIIPISFTLKGLEPTRVVLQFLETLFKHNARMSLRLIELSALDYLLDICKSTSDLETFRLISISLANLAYTSDNECQQLMITKNVPDWLFLLASCHDDINRYYACSAICILVSNKEIEGAVLKSGTLALVEPFLSNLKPAEFVQLGSEHCRRPREFLGKLMQMLNGKRREPRSLAAFHFAMDAYVKEKQGRLDVLRDIELVKALKQVAALPEEVAPKFAIQALEIIGEEVPRKMCQHVPLWTVDDVQYWICKIGFEDYASTFGKQRVDGDLLLLLTAEELKTDIGMNSNLLRKRFMKELNSLKIDADYSSVDSTNLDRLLLSIDPTFSIYTYRLLEMGIDRNTFAQLSDDILRNDIENPVHRMKLCHWMEESKHCGDVEVALLRKKIDIFISYRRSTGSQLASLIKVLLQLRGYKVFIDVDRLCAGKFDSSLLKNIQAAEHFILVLTPNALDRCLGDDDCSDWVHKEISCALEHNKNVIPVLDGQFEWPEESKLPADIRALTRFNGVRWVHEYQEACVNKVERFIKGELNIGRKSTASIPHTSRTSSIPNFRHSFSRPLSADINASNDKFANIHDWSD